MIKIASVVADRFAEESNKNMTPANPSIITFGNETSPFTAADDTDPWSFRLPSAVEVQFDWFCKHTMS